MKRRVFLSAALSLCAGLLLFFAASVYVTRANNLSLAKDMVAEAARLCAGLYASGGDFSAPQGASALTRITVIASDGSVLSDSRPIDRDLLENHLDRPEVQAALRGAPEAFVRRSDTLGTELLYYALKVDTDGGDYVFVRAALSPARIESYLSRSLPLLAALLLISLLLGFELARRTAERALAPLQSVIQRLRLLQSGARAEKGSSGEYKYEEIAALAREIDEVAGLLQENMGALQAERSKLRHIIDNIADGIFAADGDMNVVMLNASAMSIFGVTPEVAGKHLNYLTYHRALTSAVREAAGGKTALFDMEKDGRTYLVTVKPLPHTGLSAAVLSDVTESRESGKRREEFFANASHELKTPLTAIKGFGELASLHNKDGDIQKYLDGITRETERMLRLIGEVLRLSELENTPALRPEPVRLEEVVAEVREAMLPAIAEKRVDFAFGGEAEVQAEREHLYELVKNLAENAVRYNNPGGSVRVSAEGGGAPRLVVSDNGIGISPREQTRIFERFYRVEKSRSQNSGGTGLGLAIVKHICALYGWKLLLKSRPGAGTEITVTFGGGRGDTD
ncbi:MAG: PAS domain-containing protein [Oscillospiraceae bacterium]|jgi:two-component system phosphate regulon sensor histidine kinase PhoR|nr:PAS domain-containing protein [Oscillospiraceae bacterium]